MTRCYIGLLVHCTLFGGAVFNEYLRGGAVWKSMHWDDEYYSQGPDIVCGHQTV